MGYHNTTKPIPHPETTHHNSRYTRCVGIPKWDPPSLLVEIASCGICGSMLPTHMMSCPTCKAPTSERSFPVLTPDQLELALVNTSRAKIVWGLIIDSVIVLASLVTGSLLLGLTAWGMVEVWVTSWVVSGSVLGLGIGLAIVLLAYSRRGRALGGLLLGTRHVDSIYYLPISPLARIRGSANIAILDTRQGSDPLTRRLTHWDGWVDPKIGSTETSIVPSPRRESSKGLVGLFFSSGVVHWFSGVCMLGRRPTTFFGDKLALPDLSRVLQSDHLEIREITDDPQTIGVWVIDQGSRNGSWLLDGLSKIQLPAKTPITVAWGSTIQLGEHQFQVHKGRP
jgi:hypothetical protein